MSILLTDDEVSILLHENTFLTDGDFARAIQLALIEKIRKEPVGKFEQEYMNGPVIWYQVANGQGGTPLYLIKEDGG